MDRQDVFGDDSGVDSDRLRMVIRKGTVLSLYLMIGVDGEKSMGNSI